MAFNMSNIWVSGEMVAHCSSHLFHDLMKTSSAFVVEEYKSVALLSTIHRGYVHSLLSANVDLNINI